MNISANLSTVAMLCLATVIHAETPPDTSNVECQPKSVSAKNPQNPSVDSILDIQKGITAFNEAKAIKEPEKRIAALEQFIVDYPNHSNANDARAQILKAHAQQYKQEPDRVLREVEATLAKMYRPSSFVLRQVADILTTAGFDKRAEEVARMAVNDASATAEQVERIFATAKADSLAYLGRLQLAHNNLPDAEQSLKQAYAIDPNISGLPASLAGIAERSGKDSEALEYLLAATYWSQPERRKLETLYRKQHQNSLAGLEEELDARYLKANADGIAASAYRPSSSRTDRIVLAEVFSGSGCGPCVAADLAFEALLRRDPANEVAVLFYHEHTPVPDPLANPASIARSKYYGVRSVPMVYLDGDALPSIGGIRQMVQGSYTSLVSDVDRRLEIPADLDLKLVASLRKGTIQTSVEAARPGTLNARATPTGRCSIDRNHSLTLRIALVEDHIRYPGQNGIRFHAMVVRAMSPDLPSFSLQSPHPHRVNTKFELAKVGEQLKKYLIEYEKNESKERGNAFQFASKPYEVDPTRLAVVAFVQDDSDKRILQSKMVSLTRVADERR